MNSFLWKGKDAEGNVRSERVAAENAQAAKAILIEDGWSDLHLVTDEICEQAAQRVQGPQHIEELRTTLTSDNEVGFFEGRIPGFWSQFGDALFKAKGSLALFSVLAGWGIYAHRTWLTVVGFAGLGLMLVLFPLIHAFFSLPMKYYNRLNRAKVWHRWDEVLLCVERLRQTHRFTRIGVGDLELARSRAQAFAATGRLDDGLREFAKFADDPTVPHWNYLAFLAGIYDSAREYEKALECRQKAAAEKPDSSSLQIDLAYGLVRGLNRPFEAREALSRAEALEIPALGVPYLSFVRGLICWREDNFSEARQHLETALPGFKPYEQNPLVEGLLLLVKSYLCVVQASLGERDPAQDYFRQARKFLEATGEKELLQACHAALSSTARA